MSGPGHLVVPAQRLGAGHGAPRAPVPLPAGAAARPGRVPVPGPAAEDAGA